MFAKLAILFAGMFQPFNEAILMNVLDRPGTETRIKEGLVSCTLAPTNSTNFIFRERRGLERIKIE